MPVKFKPNTGTGDAGMTSLLGARRVPKTDRRIKLNALLDDLNSLLGLLKLRDKKRAAQITAAQKGILKASGLIAGAKGGMDEEVKALESFTLAAAAKLKPAKKFVLPGANEAEALAHLARTRARLCEIQAWELKAKAPAVFLNRLSDYLFLLALSRARRAGARGA